LAWLKKRAEGIQKSLTTKTKIDAEEEQEALPLDEPFAIILKSDGEPSGSILTLASLLSALDDKKTKEDMERRLYGSTIVLDARFAGLDTDGLLDDSEVERPATLDDGNEWLPMIQSEPAIRFRVRPNDESTPTTTDKGWRQRLRVPIERSTEGEPLRWLVVDKWRNDSITADDGASGALQTLVDHQKAIVIRIRAISQRLELPEPFARMLEIAASLHDEGKRADKWQKAFNAPVAGGPFAKTPGPINQTILDGYRHEFSSLPALAENPEFEKLPEYLQDLALHIVAAHHGFARPIIGTHGGDEPPSLLEVCAQEVALRFVRVQRRWGPWGIAWWESLLRAADQQASRELGATSESPNTTASNG
jgi:CRISPR-associated endonuclease/helicase Cas3